MRDKPSERVVLIPMMVKFQRENDNEVVAVLPAWRLPLNLIATGKTETEALNKLDAMMREYWSK